MYEILTSADPDVVLTIPPHPNGHAWRYAMAYDEDNAVIFSDTFAELLAGLIPNYPQLDDNGQRHARIDLAATVARWVQAALLLNPPDGYSLDDLSAEEQAILLGPRGVAIPVWNGIIPLVICDTDYAPHTTLARPLAETERLIVLAPSDAEEFLLSLQDVGWVRILESRED